MKISLILLAALLIGCASAPPTADIIVTVPCPERPVVAKPVYDIIPEDAAYDQIVVMSYKNRLKAQKYISELELVRGC